jgi:hypothetical protein
MSLCPCSCVRFHVPISMRPFPASISMYSCPCVMSMCRRQSVYVSMSPCLCPCSCSCVHMHVPICMCPFPIFFPCVCVHVHVSCPSVYFHVSMLIHRQNVEVKDAHSKQRPRTKHRKKKRQMGKTSNRKKLTGTKSQR